MLMAERRWALKIVHAAGFDGTNETERELAETLAERARMLRQAIHVSEKMAVQMMAVTLPMDIMAECDLSERLQVSADEVRDMFDAVSHAAWEFGEIDGLSAYRH
jgi:hypothetical protein